MATQFHQKISSPRTAVVTSDVQLLILHQTRPPLTVSYFSGYLDQHHSFWRHAARNAGVAITFTSAADALGTMRRIAPIARPIIWFDLPPLPPDDHYRLCEDLWGEQAPVLVPPHAYVETWDISRWFLRLQSAFVRQPPTAILEVQSADLHDPATVAALERTLRARDTLGDVAKGAGSREILRPWLGFSPLFELDGMAPWEAAAAVNLRRLGPFLIHQHENWGLPFGGIALQYLPPQVPNTPVIRVYVLGGAPVWWSARQSKLRGEAAESFRLWDAGEPESVLHALAEMAQLVSRALDATEFVMEVALSPQPYLIDVRPWNTVFEPCAGAHLASMIVLAHYLKGLAMGLGYSQALSEAPDYSRVRAGLLDAGLPLKGHGPFHVGPIAPQLNATSAAARGEGG